MYKYTYMFLYMYFDRLIILMESPEKILYLNMSRQVGELFFHLF